MENFKFTPFSLHLMAQVSNAYLDLHSIMRAALNLLQLHEADIMGVFSLYAWLALYV